MLFTSLLLLALSQGAIADKFYHWTDEKGGLHLGNVRSDNSANTLAFQKPAEDKVYRWVDEEGGVHYGDTLPETTTDVKSREVVIDDFYTSPTIEPEHYSIIAQAKRLEEARLQLEEERFTKQQVRLEKERIADELEVIRLNQLLRTQGYGQRPNGFPFAQSFSFF